MKKAISNMGDEEKKVGPIYGQQPSQYNNDFQVEGTHINYDKQPIKNNNTDSDETYINFSKQTTIPQNNNTDSDETLDDLRSQRGYIENNTNTPVPEAPAPESPASETQTVTSPKFSNLGDVNDFINERVKHYRSLQESDEDRKKRERREKRQKIMANIGDILGSMHKAYSYSRGVQPMQIENMSERMQARFDKAKAARDANEDRLYGYLSQELALENQQRQMDMQEKAFELKQKQDERAEKKEERETNLANARIGLINAQAAKNEEMAFYYAAKLKYLEMGFPMEQAMKQARIDTEKAKQAKYRHDANRPYPNRRGNSDEYVTITETETEDDGNGKKKTTTTRSRRKRSGGGSKKSSGGGYASGLSLK